MNLPMVTPSASLQAVRHTLLLDFSHSVTNHVRLPLRFPPLGDVSANPPTGTLSASLRAIRHTPLLVFLLRGDQPCSPAPLLGFLSLGDINANPPTGTPSAILQAVRHTSVPGFPPFGD